MKHDRNALKAGLFMVISLALIIAIIVAISGLERWFEPRETRAVEFALTDNIGGLRVGDEVRVGGLKVGTVREIELTSRADGRPSIVVYFEIPRKITLRRDARIVMESTVTGTSNLNIDFLGTGPEVASSEMLAGSPSQLNSLMAAVGHIAPRLDAAVQNADGAITDIRAVTMPKINTAVDHASGAAESFKQTGERAAALVSDVQGRVDPVVERYNAFADTGVDALAAIRGWFAPTQGDFTQSVANFRALTGSLKDQVPPILTRLDAIVTEAQGTVDGINVALEDLKESAANTRDATASAQSLLAGNRGKIDSMIASLKTTGTNLKAASSEIRRSPWRLLYKPGPGEMANLNLFDAARHFAEGASDMSDAANSLRDALNDPQADEEAIGKLVERLDRSFENFGAVEKELWKQVRE